MARYQLTIEYDGTAYHGWQYQPGVPTVQQEVSQALTTCCREAVDVVGSGRTDTGVHARGQIAHFDANPDLNLERLRNSLNGILPPDVAVVLAVRVGDSFHARFDACSREYHYRVSTAPVAIERSQRVHIHREIAFDQMNQAAMALLGTHDYSSFCRTQSETRNRVCTVEKAVWIPEWEESTSADRLNLGGRRGDWTFVIRADRFLHGMVRAIVGTLLEIGYGRRPQADLARVLAARDRVAAGPAAKARGLTLHHVSYNTSGAR